MDSTGKGHTRVREVKRLGAWVNGVAGRVGPSGERCGDMAGFTLFLVGGASCSHKALQVAAGHWTNLFQYRKEVSCTLNRVWRVLVKWGAPRRRVLPSIARRELLEALICLPLLQMDLRAVPSQWTTVSDASEEGGGVCV